MSLGEAVREGFGALKYFFGIKVSQSKLESFFSQQKYVLNHQTETGNLAYILVDNST